MCRGAARLPRAAVTHVLRASESAQGARATRKSAPPLPHGAPATGKCAPSRSRTGTPQCLPASARRFPASARRFPRSPAVAPPLAARPPQQKSATPRQEARVPPQKSVVFRGDPSSGAGEPDFAGRCAARARRGGFAARGTRGAEAGGARHDSGSASRASKWAAPESELLDGAQVGRHWTGSAGPDDTLCSDAPRLLRPVRHRAPALRLHWHPAPRLSGRRHQGPVPHRAPASARAVRSAPARRHQEGQERPRGTAIRIQHADLGARPRNSPGIRPGRRHRRQERIRARVRVDSNGWRRRPRASATSPGTTTRDVPARVSAFGRVGSR